MSPYSNLVCFSLHLQSQYYKQLQELSGKNIQPLFQVQRFKSCSLCLVKERKKLKKLSTIYSSNLRMYDKVDIFKKATTLTCGHRQKWYTVYNIAPGADMNSQTLIRTFQTLLTRLPAVTSTTFNLSGNTKGGSITVPLTSCLTGLESAVCQLTTFVFICKTD